MNCFKSITLKSDEIIKVYSFSGQKGKNILIIGGFHGEEPQGCLAINNYLNKLDLNMKFNNNAYFLPCLNPDGLKLNQRKNANAIDLNRNFPTKNWQKTEANDEFFGGYSPASEDETKFLIDLINEIKPDLILTLHSPFAVVNYDGEASEIAQKISELSRYPVMSDIGYPTPGSFGTYCGIERNIPTITLEFSDKESLDSIYEKSNKIFNYLLMEFK